MNYVLYRLRFHFTYSVPNTAHRLRSLTLFFLSHDYDCDDGDTRSLHPNLLGLGRW